MAIILITGLPGHGKTLYTLARWKDEAAKEKRPVFHNNIKGLNIMGWQPWTTDKWQELPAGAIMVVDEAQEPFPIRGRGEPPSHIQALAKHRHLGVDLILITQHPMLIDSFVRRLIDQHYHIVRKFGTHRATIHEFATGVKETVDKNRDGSIRHEWKYPKEVFELYQSSELHTVKRRIPMRVYMLVIIPFLFAALAYSAWRRINTPTTEAAAAAETVSKSASSPNQPFSGSTRNGQTPMTPVEYAQAYTPRIEGLAHTAPAFDNVTQPTQAPYPAACMASKTICRCYSQQATRLEIPDSLCRQITDGGFFVAWNQQTVNAVPLSDHPSQKSVSQAKTVVR